MEIRNLVLGLAGRSRIGDRVALGNARALPDAQCADMGERHLVAVAGHDRHGEPVHRHRTCKGNQSRRGCANESRFTERDVDPTVLAGCIGVVPQREGPQDGAVCRPRPCPCGRGGAQSPRRRREKTDGAARCLEREHATTVARVVGDGNAIDCLVTEIRGRARCERLPSTARRPRPQPDAEFQPRRDPQPRRARRRRPRRPWTSRQVPARA